MGGRGGGSGMGGRGGGSGGGGGAADIVNNLYNKEKEMLLNKSLSELVEIQKKQDYLKSDVGNIKKNALDYAIKQKKDAQQKKEILRQRININLAKSKIARSTSTKKNNNNSLDIISTQITKSTNRLDKIKKEITEKQYKISIIKQDLKSGLTNSVQEKRYKKEIANYTKQVNKLNSNTTTLKNKLRILSKKEKDLLRNNN